MMLLDRHSGQVGTSRSNAVQPIVNVMGDHVALGPLSREVLGDYQRWLNDFAMLASLDRRFRPITIDWIEGWYERHAKGVAHTMVFTLWEVAGWRPIGNGALQDIDFRNRTAEFGLFIGEADRRGRGFGTEAASLLLEFRFRVLGLHTMMLRVFEYNLAARRCYERVGFREFGRQRESQFMDGRFWDVIYMECLAADFATAVPSIIHTNRAGGGAPEPSRVTKGDATGSVSSPRGDHDDERASSA